MIVEDQDRGNDNDVHMTSEHGNNNNLDTKPVVAPLSPNVNRQLLMPKDQLQSIFLTDSRIEETKWGAGGNAGGAGHTSNN